MRKPTKNQRGSRRGLPFLLGVALVTAPVTGLVTAPVMALVTGLVMGLALISVVAPTASRAEEPIRVVPESAEQVRLSYAPIVRQVAPSVVNIYTRRIVSQRQVFPFFDDPFFERFFGTPRERVQNSLGSGVIIDADGLIVTNHHVIEHSDEVIVVLSDRREFAATVIGSDERTDLAVLRIEAGGEVLPRLELGDSDTIDVGDLVLAIGNPFGVGQTVTSGIVSALARTTVSLTDVGAFIQTDAAVNPGNSGGALVTLDAKLIGINTAIYSRSGGSVGIGFAIPSNLVRTVVDSIVAGGRAIRPWLGADGQAVTADLAASLGLSRPVGVLVNRLHPLGPALAAGIEIGDVIYAVDGYEVYDPQGLRFRLATRPTGGEVVLAVLRDGDALSVVVPLSPPPEDPPRDIRALSGRHPLDGAVVANLSPAYNEEIGVDQNRTGVIVIEVRRGAAARLGLRPGDVVVAIAGVTIETTGQLEDVLDRRRAEWEVVIERAGKTLRVVVQS